jgi:hypothetical protein
MRLTQAALIGVGLSCLLQAYLGIQRYRDQGREMEAIEEARYVECIGVCQDEFYPDLEFFAKCSESCK